MRRPARSSHHRIGEYTHDLDGWIKRFAKQLKGAPGGNPIERLLKLDPECNPYFLTFLVYWYRTPGPTLAERSVDRARSVTRRMKSVPARLREIVTDLRSLADLRVPPQFGFQTGELITAPSPSTEHNSPGKQLTELARECESVSAIVDRVLAAIRDQASLKRNPRNVYEVLLFVHLCTKLGSEAIAPIALALLDCADVAFAYGLDDTQSVQQWASIKQSEQRFRERLPGVYEWLAGRARRNRKMMSAEETQRWSRLSKDDCTSIAADLRPRFDREIQLLKQTSQSF